ncbi:MAG: hypothetical protein LBH97_06545, partial [Treponema sp.]|nr:hypothetical protein [Treponema sp.]
MNLFFRRFWESLCLVLMIFTVLSCFRSKSPQAEIQPPPETNYFPANTTVEVGLLAAVIRRAELPDSLARRIQDAAVSSPNFIFDLLLCLEGDPLLWTLVDKQHS